MKLIYILLFIIFVADVVWVIVYFMRIAGKRSGNEDDEGGILQNTDPELDLPPGISLPDDYTPGTAPGPVFEEEELATA